MANFNTIVLIVAVLGLLVGGYFAARSPVFWLTLIREIVNRLLPKILKRMPPEEEQAMREAYRRGEPFKRKKRRGN